MGTCFSNFCLVFLARAYNKPSCRIDCNEEIYCHDHRIKHNFYRAEVPKRSRYVTSLCPRCPCPSNVRGGNNRMLTGMRCLLLMPRYFLSENDD
ncbi:hypothetical protein F5Y03DRAFT_215106 [Xylaria venustula]|nr:hypothetical protein F5Y03DRAFT_215106 [Xylaria venustula]